MTTRVPPGGGEGGEWGGGGLKGLYCIGEPTVAVVLVLLRSTTTRRTGKLHPLEREGGGPEPNS